jgi:predicted metal-dependent hydrolase
MSRAIVRALRRIVDSLQRGLFDDEPAPVAPAPPLAVEPRPGPRVASGPSVDALLRHPRATRELVVEGRAIAFRFARAKRKSIGFVVDGDGLTVRAPKWVSLREVDAAVREKGRWIVARLAEQRERARQQAAARTVWRDGASVAYLGRPLTIVLDPRGDLGAGEAALLDGAGAQPPRLRVGLPGDAGEERVKDAVQSWLQREARRIFAARTAHFAERLGVTVRRLALSSAKTRWGSANANGSVRLHWRLIQQPMATIDYVVAHELAHLREMNHSPRFWNVVRSVVPEYEEVRRELRASEYSPGDPS